MLSVSRRKRPPVHTTGSRAHAHQKQSLVGDPCGAAIPLVEPKFRSRAKVSSKWRMILHSGRCFVPACAEDRPTDFGAVKAGETAGFGAEVMFADRPLVA